MKCPVRARRWLPALALATAVLCPAAAVGQDVQAVPIPSSLVAEAVSTSQIDLRWTPVNTGQVVEYRIYRYPSNAVVATVPASTDSYSDTGLSPWTEHSYYVTGATASGNESGPSNIATARTWDGTPPGSPANLEGRATGATQITLSWTAASDPESGVTDYVIYRDGGEIGRSSGLTYQDSGLTADRQYSYQVSAVNGQGDEGARAGPISVRTQAEPPPDPPRDLTAQAFSASAIDVSWRSPADDGDVASYRIYRNGAVVGSATGTSYRDSGLNPFTVYEYYATSVNGSGEESDPSNAASARTFDGTAPTAPGSLAGAALSESQISLNWSAATDPQTGIDEYIVYRGGGEIDRTSDLTYQDTGLSPDELYSYEVSAVNGQGMEGSRAGPIQVRTFSREAPDPPTGLAARVVDANTIDLTWDLHPDGDLDGYRLYRDGLFVAGTTATSFLDSGLTPFTTYVYTVTAVSEDGDESAPSESASATTSDATPPSVPQNVTADPAGAESVDVSWSPSADPEAGVAGYRVFRNGEEVAAPAGTQYTDMGLMAATTYEYRISARNEEGLESELSAPAFATTFSVEGPPPPTGLSATPISPSRVSLSWTPPEGGAAGYRVFRDGTFVATVTGTAFVDTDLQPQTTYAYTVASVDSEGIQGSASAEVSATTPALADVTPPAAPTGLRLVTP